MYNVMEHFVLCPQADMRMEALLTGERKKEVVPLKTKKTSLRWLIAAVLIVCLLAGTALAVASVRTEIKLLNLSWLMGEPSLEILAPPLDNEYIEFYYHYPQALPEGFEESFVSQRRNNRQSLRFENADGDFLFLSYGAANDATSLSVGYAFEKEELELLGSRAYLIRAAEPMDSGLHYELLVWIDAEKAWISVWNTAETKSLTSWSSPKMWP